jgi:serine/threonine protein kinase
MTPDETEWWEEKLASYLADGDDALAAGKSPETPTAHMSTENAPQLQQDLAYLKKLRRVLRRAGSEASRDSPGFSKLPNPFGRFHIRRELGRGGFGVVFLAYDPLLARDVALKVPRPEVLATPDLRARFHREARAAAGLDHPNLVPVHEAGEVDSICYLVSAYCPGPTLSEWLKARKEPVPWREAAELLIALADAAHHAHERGLVHRDLKPGNILLQQNEEGRMKKEENEQATRVAGESSLSVSYSSPYIPKIADFGLAKQILPSEDEKTLTHSGAIVGTASYMAPEQASGKSKEVGPPADIYALGAIFYEVLTGRPPFKGESDLETLLLVQVEEPLAPSRLRPRVPRDLETICLKCLEKDPKRRYGKAKELAEDLRHWLKGEPIRARPVRSLERLWRWSMRNRAVAGLTATVALVLMVGIVSSSLLAISANNSATEAKANEKRALGAEQGAKANLEQARANEKRALGAEKEAKTNLGRAREEEQKAKESETESRAVLEFFQNRVLAAARPEGQEGGLGTEVTVRKALAAAEPEIARAFAGQPKMEAAVRKSIALTYLYLREPQRAVEHLEKARALREAELGPDDPDTLETMNDLAMAYQETDRIREAIGLMEETLRRQKAKLGSNHPHTLNSMNNLAAAYYADARLDQATRLWRETLNLRRAHLGDEHHETLATMHNLAVAYHEMGRLSDAIPLFQETLALKRKKLGSTHAETLATVNALAVAYRVAGRLNESVPLFEEALKLRKDHLGPDHGDTLNTMLQLAATYLAAGRWADALPMFQETVKLHASKLGADHLDTLNASANLAECYRVTGGWSEAIALLEKTLALQKSKLSADHPDTLITLNFLGVAYRSAGRLGDCVRISEEVVKLRKAKIGTDHPRTLASMNNLALAYLVTGRSREALPLAEETLALRKAKLGEDHPETVASMNTLALALRANGRLPEALVFFQSALDLAKAKLGTDHPDTLEVVNNLACAYDRTGKLSQAEELFRDALAGRKRKLGPDHPDTLRTLADSADNMIEQNRYPAAKALLRSGLAIFEKARRDSWERYRVMAALGGVLVGEEKYAEAEPLLIQGYDGMSKREARIPAPDKVHLKRTAERLFQLYESQNMPEKANAWRERAGLR